MTDPAPASTVFRVAELNERRPTLFDIQPDKAQIRQIEQELDVISIKKLRFRGELRASGKSEWVLSADLGATVTQPCVISLNPVTTRLDEKIIRRFVPESQIRGIADDAGEIEMDGDDTLEPLGNSFDLTAMMIEALALALPDYPRADDVALDQTNFTQDGLKPMTDEDAKPFASLAALKQKMQKDD